MTALTLDQLAQAARYLYRAGEYDLEAAVVAAGHRVRELEAQVAARQKVADAADAWERALHPDRTGGERAVARLHRERVALIQAVRAYRLALDARGGA